MNYSEYRVICNSNYLKFHTEAVFITLIEPLWNRFKPLYKSPEKFLRAINECGIPSLVELNYYCTR